MKFFYFLVFASLLLTSSISAQPQHQQSFSDQPSVGCFTKQDVETPPTHDMSDIKRSIGNAKANCAPPYYIRVNIHFILDGNGLGNFTETDDGGSNNAADWNIAGNWNYGSANTPLPTLDPDPNYNGYKFAENVILAANVQWQTNPRMQLPTGNSTPNPDKGVMFVLNGVYFHRDAALYKYDPVNLAAPQSGVYATDQFDTYGVNKPNEINVFLMGQATSPNLTPSDGQWIYGTGVGAGIGYQAGNNWVKVGNAWRIHLINRLPSRNNANAVPGAMASILNHEIGHLVNLKHPFQGGNGCADTPVNSSSGAGNNLMDYGTQIALTPCQIGIAQNEVSTYYGNYSTCQGCLPSNAFFTLPETLPFGSSTRPSCPVMDARASFAETNYSYNITEVNSRNQPIGPMFTQTGTGEVGAVCLGSVYTFVADTRYQVSLTVANNCTSSTMVKYMRTCTACRVMNPANTARTGSAAFSDSIESAVQMYPNPATAAGFTLISPFRPTQLPAVRDSQGQSVSLEQLAQRHDETGWHTTYRLTQQQAKPGLYIVETRDGGKHNMQHLSVQPD